MINKNYPENDYDVSCDYCDLGEENYDTDGDWTEMIAEAKVDGWSINKVNGQWKHRCPDCTARDIPWKEEDE